MVDLAQEEENKNHIVRTVKAIILSGGKGTRGKPYTEYFPKAMIPVYGKPLISYIVEYLNSFSFVDKIIIIADFKGLGGQIKNYYKDQKIIKKIEFVQDSQRGTGGDLLYAEKHLKGDKKFVLWFVDNLCAIDLDKMKNVFEKNNSIACIATRTKRTEATGFAVVKGNIIQEFKEKPEMTLPLAECLGIYIISNDILAIIKKNAKKKEINLSFDVLQNLPTRNTVSAYDIGKTEWLDVESPVIIERNEKTVKKIIKQMES